MPACMCVFESVSTRTGCRTRSSYHKSHKSHQPISLFFSSFHLSRFKLSLLFTVVFVVLLNRDSYYKRFSNKNEQIQILEEKRLLLHIGSDNNNGRFNEKWASNNNCISIVWKCKKRVFVSNRRAFYILNVRTQTDFYILYASCATEQRMFTHLDYLREGNFTPIIRKYHAIHIWIICGQW